MIKKRFTVISQMGPLVNEIHEDGYANSSRNKASNDNPCNSSACLGYSFKSPFPRVIRQLQGRQHLAVIAGSHKDHVRVGFNQSFL